MNYDENHVTYLNYYVYRKTTYAHLYQISFVM